MRGEKCGAILGVWVILILLISVSVSAEETVRVWGRVTDAITGGPISNAKIDIWNSVTNIGGGGFTNTTGFYTATDLFPGIYKMKLTTSGYAGILKLINASSDISLDFALGKGAVVSGRVTDSSGDPLMGMGIIAENKYFEGWGEAVTDANGYYSFNLLPGNYSINVYDSSRNYVPALPQIIEVNEGDNVSGIDFVVSAAGFISGDVTDHTGGKIDELGVVAFNAGTRLDIEYIDSVAPVISAPVNNMKYNLEPLSLGMYDLYLIISQEFINGGFTVAVFDQILGANLSGANLTGMNFEVQSAGGTLTGTVTGSGPIGWATIVVTSTEGDFTCYPMSDINGSYVCYHIPPGSYIIEAKKMNYIVFSEAFSIAEDEVKTLDIELNDGISTLSGYVFNTSNESLADVPVSLINSSEKWFRTKTDIDGYFEFANFPDSTYELLIHDIYSDVYPPLEEYTTIDFQYENMINLTEDLEINATLLKIDTNITLNASNFENGDTIEASITVTNNEGINLMDWKAFLVIEDKDDEDLFFLFNQTNLTANTAQSYIFEYTIPEDNTYGQLKFSGGLCIGGVCGGDFEVDSSEGKMGAINYKISEERVISLLKGDVNGDCVVNIFDLAAVGLAYGSQPDDANWNENADVTDDGKVNIFDLATVGLNYGETC